MKFGVILSMLFLLAAGAPANHTLVTDDTDEGDVIVGAIYMVIVETVASLAACVGILSTSEKGGRVVGAAFGVPVIMLAVAPVLVDWLRFPQYRWMYGLLIVPFSLGCACLWYGFRKRKVRV